ncbi:MAG: hypothetical protein J3T61_08840 [Candidatus Brocadiales bacterium]|nr:hypothetical protein [Candidatus Bathyanammoxibius sp.]
MGFFSKISGAEIARPIDAIGNAIDKVFTSDEERLQGQAVLAKLALHQDELQVEMNKVEANHRSLFVAGWRPALGWVCVLGLALTFIASPLLEWGTGVKGPELPTDIMLELVLGMLGLGALRTYEKLAGRTK